jgi:proline dehydrogenase
MFFQRGLDGNVKLLKFFQYFFTCEYYRKMKKIHRLFKNYDIVDEYDTKLNIYKRKL